jgi:hypothetical protein
MNDLLHILLGAALVSTGVLAGALADRIRGLRIERIERRQAPQPRQHESSWPIPDKRRGQEVLKIQAPPSRDAADVIAALVASGYKKSVASEAAMRCTAAERASIESWTRAALRNCAQGASS